jgi:3-hydroxybutyryl-CoA dehydratase
LRAFVGERFFSEVTLTPAKVAAFSVAAGDVNPIHFDAQFAATTRFGKVIASGTHTSALLLGLTATHFSQRGSVVGLEFTVTFRRAVFADETVRVEWDVIKVTPNAKLKGEIVDMLGRLLGGDGQPSVEAKGRVLVAERL